MHNVRINKVPTQCVRLLYTGYNLNSEEIGLGAIQVLRNADGGGGVYDFLEKSVTKV